MPFSRVALLVVSCASAALGAGSPNPCIDGQRLDLMFQADPIADAGHQTRSLYAHLLGSHVGDYPILNVPAPEDEVGHAVFYAAIVSRLEQETDGGDGGDGVQFWSLSLAALGEIEFVSAWTRGTAGATFPDGLRIGGYEHTEVIDPNLIHPVSGEPQGEGIVSVVLLAFDSRTALAHRGTATVLGFEIQATSVIDGAPVDGDLVFVDDLRGSGEPVKNLASVGFELSPFCVEQSIAVRFFSASRLPFIRGDANADGGFDVSDAIFLLEWLFLGGDRPACFDSADLNASRYIDLSDSVSALQFLFGGGPPPLPPYPDCGLPQQITLLQFCESSGCI